MLLVACSGFPVPVSRYWDAFPAVEISDTEIAMPGRGSIRRWTRESPEDFAFSVLAPKLLGDTSFKKTAESDEALTAVMALCTELKARALVFGAPATFTPTKTNRAALKRIVGLAPRKGGPALVFDFPAWKPAQVLEAAQSDSVVAAYDPLLHEPVESGPLRYIRLAGPAGHRSRYDEPSIDQLSQHIKALPDVSKRDTFCVFCNIDMETNANQLLGRLSAR
ncbi:MAG: DUF72 domain-containing protein [Sandaracinaceae bacterium]|nr:DUF72 domain-containing protein [Sandaracinaceae bacterium]